MDTQLDISKKYPNAVSFMFKDESGSAVEFEGGCFTKEAAAPGAVLVPQMIKAMKSGRKVSVSAVCAGANALDRVEPQAEEAPAQPVK